jgi:16S rRNA processing protein RimM
MANPGFISIGYTKKPHGAAGELKASIGDRFLETVLETGVVFVGVQGKPVPYFLESVRESSDLLLKFEGIDTPDQARVLNSCTLYLRESDLPAMPEAPQPGSFVDYKGFTIVEEGGQVIGPIVEVVENPWQEVAVVAWQEREVMIPLHADLVCSVDKAGRRLVLRLPEGLLDL